MRTQKQKKLSDLYKDFSHFIEDASTLPPSEQNTQALCDAMAHLLQKAEKESLIEPKTMHDNGNWLGERFFVASNNNRYKGVKNPQNHLANTARFVMNEIRSKRACNKVTNPNHTL